MLNEIISKVNSDIELINVNVEEVFIACASFEDRTTAVADRLSQKYKASTSFICKYDERSKTSRRDKNFHKLSSKISQHSNNVLPVICNHHDPLDGISKFRAICQNTKMSFNGKNISVDVTTFTKQYLLVLLKFLESYNPNSIRLFYTEPEDYAVKWEKPLSYGLVDIVSVPTYGGHCYTEKESLLILLLGYEGDRAYSIWEKLTPHKTIVLIGKPSFRGDWDGRVEEFNKKLISELPKDAIKYVPTVDPFKVRRCLDELIGIHSDKFNIAISPLGPKPQVIGCWLSVKKNPDIQISYAIPKRHEEKYFSKNIGTIWEYR